jgi:hypothetical protein
MSRTSPNYATVIGSSDSMLQQGAVQNGRVDLLSPMTALEIPAFQQQSVRNDTFVGEATVGQMGSTELSRLFFSETNINALQDGLRYRVFVETNGQYVIGRQSEQELKIVMRSTFYQHAKNRSSNVVGQVRELNAKVLEWVVPEVLSNIKQHEVFRRDASSLPMPMERAPLITNKGTKSLEMKEFL